jgi:hypothetical protein
LFDLTIAATAEDSLSISPSRASRIRAAFSRVDESGLTPAGWSVMQEAPGENRIVSVQHSLGLLRLDSYIQRPELTQ